MGTSKRYLKMGPIRKGVATDRIKLVLNFIRNAGLSRINVQT